MTSLRFPPDFALLFCLRRDLRFSSCEYSGVEFFPLRFCVFLARALGCVESLRYSRVELPSPLGPLDSARCAYLRQALRRRAKSSRVPFDTHLRNEPPSHLSERTRASILPCAYSCDL